MLYVSNRTMEDPEAMLASWLNLSQSSKAWVLSAPEYLKCEFNFLPLGADGRYWLDHISLYADTSGVTMSVRVHRGSSSTVDVSVRVLRGGELKLRDISEGGMSLKNNLGTGVVTCLDGWTLGDAISKAVSQ